MPATLTAISPALSNTAIDAYRVNCLPDISGAPIEIISAGTVEGDLVVVEFSSYLASQSYRCNAYANNTAGEGPGSTPETDAYTPPGAPAIEVAADATGAIYANISAPTPNGNLG